MQLFADDEDLREAIEASMRKGKLGLLAELWVNGVSIDWELLPDARFGRLIRMPGLPFMAERLPPTGADQELRSGAEAVSSAADPDEQCATLRRVQTVMAELLGADADDIEPDPGPSSLRLRFSNGNAFGESLAS